MPKPSVEFFSSEDRSSGDGKKYAGGYEYERLGDGSIKITHDPTEKAQGLIIPPDATGPLGAAYASIAQEMDTGTSKWTGEEGRDLSPWDPSGTGPTYSAAELVTEAVNGRDRELTRAVGSMDYTPEQIAAAGPQGGGSRAAFEGREWVQDPSGKWAEEEPQSIEDLVPGGPPLIHSRKTLTPEEKQEAIDRFVARPSASPWDGPTGWDVAGDWLKSLLAGDQKTRSQRYQDELKEKDPEEYKRLEKAGNLS